MTIMLTYLLTYCLHAKIHFLSLHLSASTKSDNSSHRVMILYCAISSVVDRPSSKFTNRDALHTNELH